MLTAKWLVPAACLTTALSAQSFNDLNGLASAASHFVSSGMAASRDPQPLGLHKIVGNYDDKAPNTLMNRASDVQHWTFLYKIQVGPGPQAPAGPPHPAVTAECSRGVFHDFHYSDKPVQGLKGLDNTWIATSLENAIANLNANGYVRGFTAVSIMRPDMPNWSDELVYVFKCPWERRDVAISCQTGAMVWTYGY